MKPSLAVIMLAFVMPPLAADGAVTGQWDFDSGDLRATIGTSITFLDGADGPTAKETQIDTTTKFGIPNIGGKVVKVLRFPEMKLPTMGYVVKHGAEPNGEGTRVNQYTVVMDVFFPAASSGAFRSLFQTDNSQDGDFYLNPANGIGISGDYAGEAIPDQWHRLAFAVDVSGRNPSVLKFVDGVKASRQILSQGRDGRWSLGSTLQLFTDPAGESRAGFLNSLQVRDRALSEAELELLGGPTAAGIPTNDLPVWPFVDKMVPAADVFGVGQETDIYAEILDGQNGLERGTIHLAINRRAVMPAISRVGTRTVVRYQPRGELQPSTNFVVLRFGAGARSFTNAWHFVTVAAEQKRAIAGQWDFDHGDLRPTMGSALQYLGGNSGASRRAMEFGTTTEFGIANIQGKAAHILKFSGATTREIGLIMAHGMLPNGGEGVSRVNQWSLILDVLIPNANGEQWFAVLQTDSANTSDADLYVQFANRSGSFGTLGQYAGEGAILPGRWHRLAVAVDVANSTMEKYVDGQLFAVQELGQFGLDGRYSLASASLLFADESRDSQPAYVNSIQIRNYLMDGDEMRALGGAAASGIATNISPSLK